MPEPAVMHRRLFFRAIAMLVVGAKAVPTPTISTVDLSAWHEMPFTMNANTAISAIARNWADGIDAAIVADIKVRPYA